MTPKTIKERFEEGEADRSQFLANARDYAALTIADVLPPLNHNRNEEFPGHWRNIGGVGVENIVGRMLTAIFPVGVPWFGIRPSAELLGDRTLSDAEKSAFTNMLYQRELLVASKIEATNYRLAGRSALESLIVCGDSLTRQADDYDQRYFRLDNWVCRRSGSGLLIWTITREARHPMEYTDEQKRLAKIKGDEKSVDLYTLCERQGEPGRWTWRIEQEANGAILNESDETVTPYNCVAYRLCPGEDYARGFISTRFPDIKSDNFLWEALIFGMGNAAKMVPVMDPNEPNLRPEDLCKPNGTPIAGRVREGKVQGIAFLQTDKTADFGIALQGAQALEASLGKAMLLETEAMPKGDRVTAFAVGRIAQELQGALGGPYAHIADQLQRPYLERTIHQMERDKLLPYIEPRLTKRGSKIEILTGASALSRQMDLDKLLSAIQVIATFQGGVERLNMEIVADRVLQGMGVDTTGLIKDAEQVAADFQARAQQMLTEEGAKVAAKTIGAIIESRATQAP